MAESNGSLLPGQWRDSLHVKCGLTACTPGSAPGPALGNEYGKTLPFTFYSYIQWRRNYRDKGVHCTPKFRTCSPCTPKSKMRLMSKFKQTILTTRLYKVRTNLYPHLRKRSDAPAYIVKQLSNCVISRVDGSQQRGYCLQKILGMDKFCNQTRKRFRIRPKQGDSDVILIHIYTS